MSLEIRLINVGMMQENCYVLYDPEKAPQSCVLIDPGDEPERIGEELSAMGLKPLAILLTHGHFDHIGAVPGLLDRYPETAIYACEAELPLLSDSRINLSEHFVSPVELKEVRGVRDGEELSLLGHSLKVLATPGHTAGSCCYYEEAEGMLFCGDTLFRRSYGRTDLPTGSEEDMVVSLRERLFKLPEGVTAFPGHGDVTDIGYERKYNPCGA